MTKVFKDNRNRDASNTIKIEKTTTRQMQKTSIYGVTSAI